MARFAYFLTAGRASDLRFVPVGYVLQGNEQEGNADTLPTIDSLSSVPDPQIAAAAVKTALFTDVDCQDILNKLRGATPAQIKTYVQNNVTDLPSAKLLLAKILLILGRLV